MGFWWSKTPIDLIGNLSRTLSSNNFLGDGMGNKNENYGFSVRCIKD
jgi:hypothetical protein